MHCISHCNHNYILGAPRKLSRIYLNIFRLNLMKNSSSQIVLNDPCVNALQPKTTRKTPIVEQVGFFAHCSDSTHTMGNCGYLRKKVSSESTYRIWACRGRFWLGSRKWGFALDSLLSGSGDNSMTRYRTKSYV